MGKLSKYVPYITISNNDIPLDPVTLTDAGTWYPLTSTKLITRYSNKMSNLNGVITHEGQNWISEFKGTADVSVDKACNICFELRKDGVPLLGVISDKDYASASKIGVLAKVHHVELVNGSNYQVYAKSSVALTEITVSTMSLVFGG